MLLEHGQTHGRGITADFGSMDLRTGSSNLSRKQPLARAFGRTCTSIIDATAGLGHDAFLLAGLGYRVIAIERAPALAALLADGVRRALASPEFSTLLGDRLQVRCGDSRELLGSDGLDADAVYLDPMFPPKRKRSALAPKTIRMIRQLAGDDPDAVELWHAARRAATHRIVVKRPLHADPLGAGGEMPVPDVSQRGKLARYDVYVTPRR